MFSRCHIRHILPVLVLTGCLTTSIIHTTITNIILLPNPPQTVDERGHTYQTGKPHKNKTAEFILGKEEVEIESTPPRSVDLDALRMELRPNFPYLGAKECFLSFEKRSCNDKRKPRNFVSGDLLRCMSDIIFDETNNYKPDADELSCLQFYHTQFQASPKRSSYPFLVFVKTEMIHSHPTALKNIEEVVPGPYILLTHNSDLGIDNDTRQQALSFGSSKLLHWFGQNMISSNISTPIPIGLDNQNNHWLQRSVTYASELLETKEMGKKRRQGIHFRTYGNGVYAKAKMRLVGEANETGWFTTSKAFGPDDLSEEFHERHKEILSLPRGGGYWIWKFYLIEQWMDALDEGDILVYLDAGSQINKRGEKRFFEYVNMVNGSPYDMLGFQIHPNLNDYKWTTTRLLNTFNVTEQTHPAITHTAQFESGTLVIQKGPHYRKWMKLCWEVYLSDPWMITDKYNEETKKINPSFKENRHDQSIMSVSRKLLGCVRIDGFETKGAKPDMPFHVMRKKD